MTEIHPITPPPELVDQWRAIPEYADISEKLFSVSITTNKLRDIATQAARWGADQELDACCEWLHWQNLATHPELIPSLRAARRPKAPSLKKQALQALYRFDDTEGHEGLTPEQIAEDFVLIRRALEALPE